MKYRNRTLLWLVCLAALLFIGLGCQAPQSQDSLLTHHSSSGSPICVTKSAFSDEGGQVSVSVDWLLEMFRPQP